MEQTAMETNRVSSIRRGAEMATPFYCARKKVYLLCPGEHFAGEICPHCHGESDVCNYTTEQPGFFWKQDIGHPHPHLPPRVQ
jgi:hypothetical protein